MATSRPPSSRFREDFDPSRDFVASREFKCAGVPQTRGKPFEKDLVTVRRLRQLYDSRYISHSDEEKPSRVVSKRQRVRSKRRSNRS